MFSISSKLLFLQKFLRLSVKTPRRRSLERNERLGERRAPVGLLISFRSIERYLSRHREAKITLWCQCQSQRTKMMRSRAVREVKRSLEIWKGNWKRWRKKISKTIKGCLMEKMRVIKERLQVTEVYIPKLCHPSPWIRFNSCSNKYKHLLTTSRQHICSSHILQLILHPWSWQAI